MTTAPGAAFDEDRLLRSARRSAGSEAWSATVDEWEPVTTAVNFD